MKSSLIFLALLIVFSYSAKLESQTLYIPSGAVGIGESSNENIGIGTTSVPSEKLEVVGYIKAGYVSMGGKTFTESPKNYVNLATDRHGTLLLSSNLYLNDSKLYIANTHTTMAGAAIKIPGNGQERQGDIEFWTSPRTSVTSANTFAQSTPRMVLNNLGNLGIGTPTPNSPLEILSPINDKGLTIGATGKNTKVYLHVAGGDYGYLYLGGNTTIRGNGNDSYIDGKVGIGVDPGLYKLNVWGKIRAHEIVVNTNGADFVFEPTYKLRPLSELETFIKEHKHLPEIAPAKEMQENGVSAGEMQTKLLQKVEELTLYILMQEQKMEKMQKEIDQLKNSKN